MKGVPCRGNSAGRIPSGVGMDFKELKSVREVFWLQHGCNMGEVWPDISGGQPVRALLPSRGVVTFLRRAGGRIVRTWRGRASEQSTWSLDREHVQERGEWRLGDQQRGCGWEHLS